MKIVYLEDLPRWESGTNKGRIDWVKSIGYKVKFIYDDIEGEVEIVDYDKTKESLNIKYLDKEPFKIKTGNFQRCQLGKLLSKITNEFKVEIGTTFKDDQRDLVVINREYRNRIDNKGNNKFYNYICNKCGYNEGWMVENHLIDGQGCTCCSGRKAVLGINTIWDTDRWMVDLGVSEEDAKKYTRSSNETIDIICPNCKTTKEVVIGKINFYKTIGCTCGDGYSYGHKFVFNLLIQLSQDFKDNKKFDWCRFYNPYKNKKVSGEYDFVLKNNKLIIEVDGSFHRKDNSMNGQTKEESEFIDNEKDKLAIEHGYNIVRISDEDDIKDNILKSELSQLFNLSNVSWAICEEFALSNRVKSICDFKRNNPDMTILDIAKEMKLGRTTIARYLKKGNKLGWCHYDAKEEKEKNNKMTSERSRRMRSKPVEIFKDGVSLGVFESAKELERQSVDLFNLKMWQANISAVCRSVLSQYKGFTFKYIE